MPPPPKKKPNSKLKIGFFSSDLRSHSVVNFALPIFRNYDRDNIEIHCYSPVEAVDDQKQEQVRELVTEFNIINNMNFRDGAEAIRKDGIDIVFELNGFHQGHDDPVADLQTCTNAGLLARLSVYHRDA